MVRSKKKEETERKDVGGKANIGDSNMFLMV